MGGKNSVEAAKEDEVRSIGSDEVDRGEKYGKRHDYDPDFNGPLKNRSCTDVLCLLLFIAMIAGWIFVAVTAFTKGKPMTLIYPSNSKGEICGQDQHKDKPYVLFFDITRCLSASTLTAGCPTKQVCVKECPKDFGSPYTDVTGQELTDMKRKMFPYCTTDMTEEMIADDDVTTKDLINDQICPQYWVKSAKFLKRCIPYFSTFRDETVEDETVLVDDGKSKITVRKMKDAVSAVVDFLDLRSVGERLFADLEQTWWIILIMFVFAMLIALLWIVLMRWIAAVMVWTSLIVAIGLLVASCAFTWIKYESLRDAGDHKPGDFNDIARVGFTVNATQYTELASTWLILFIISIVLLIIFLLVLLFMRNRIRLAIELIEEGSIAVGDIMSTLFFPLIPFVFEVIVVVWFLVISLFIASMSEQQYRVNSNEDASDGCLSQEGLKCPLDDDGKPQLPGNLTTVCPKATCDFVLYGRTQESVWLGLYNLFALLWVLFFTSAMEEMIMAGAFATWYFTVNRKKLPAAPLTGSAYRVFRYHLGTLAFGSLIITAIRLIRLMIEYIEAKLKEYSQDNPVIKCVLCFCRCCFWCLESFMKFINRNAYIMTAIYGKNFCWSAKESFSLLMRNALRVFVLDKVTDTLLLLGKLVVVGVVTLTSYLVFSGRIGYIDDDLEHLNYYVLPIAVVALFSYFIADVFFEVYEMAVDTIFLCFLEDIERNDGSAEKPYFMSKDLRKILGYMENQSRPSTPKRKNSE